MIQTFVGNGSPSPAKTFDLSSTTPDHYALASVTDPNDGLTDYTVLAYTDNNQVHLELLNDYGQQIGSDFIVPGITSFDRLHTIFGSANNAFRVELDYTVPDPKGGTEVEGLIYDTSPTGYYNTLSGGGEYEGSPFDDTFIDGPGNYTVNGGGGQDYFQINQDSNEVVFAFAPSNQLAVSTYDSTTLIAANLTGTATLIGFSQINLNDESVTESTSVGGGVQLNLQNGSTFGGTIDGFASDDAIAFANVAFAVGDRAVFTSNGAGGGTVSVENAGGTQVASFNVDSDYQSSQFGVSAGTGGALVVSGPTWQQTANPLANFGWAQGWGSANNPREVVSTATNPSDGADYIGFGTSSVVMALGESTANGPNFANAIAAVHNFGSTEGYTAVVQRGAADTGDTIAPTVYGQGFKGVYWYDATGGTAANPTYQSTPNLYPNFGSQQGWTPANGFDVVKADSSDAYASILGFGNAGIVVGPQAFDPSTSGSPPASYLIPFAAGNNSGWSQTTDIRSFVDSNGQAIDLNGDGVTDFVGMGPQGLEFAFGSDTGGQYSLGALQLAQINGTNSDFGDAQGWNDSNTTRDIVKDPTTGYYDIIAFGAAGVYVSMGQDPSTHGGQPFGQSYLALDNFGLNQGWSNTLTPRLVGDVNGDGIPDIVGFGANKTFTALGSFNGSGDLIFTMDPTATIANYGYNEGWSTSNTIRTLADVDGSGADSLVVSGAANTQVLKLG